jgi:PAS domain S-box-containing protein
MRSVLPSGELIEQTADMISVVDESGRIQYENRAVRRITGYDPGERVGEELFEYVHPDDRQEVIDTVSEIVESGGDGATVSVEFRHRHADGSWIWLESRGGTGWSADIDGYVVSSRDVSDRKESEQELQRERDRLDRFVSVVAHDLRNPLNVAKGQLELAREEHASERLDGMEESLDRMTELIDDLLTLTRESETDPLTDAVDLGEAAEKCWRNVDTKAATLDVRTSRTVVADEGQFRQVLENLFRNAVEHGGADVTVTVGALENGFYVADDGQGVPENVRDSLLEYGFTTKEDGTGFGLSIVTEIVENHGWSLAVTESEAGGARFDVTGVEFA